MKRVVFICVLIALAACKDEFDVFEVPGKDFKIAIQSFNEVGHPWYIQTAVSKSAAPIGTLDSLANAVVKIYEDEKFVEQLKFSGMNGHFVHPAIFRSSTNSPRPGHEYKITVEAPGYPMAIGTYKQPEPVPAEMTFKFHSRQRASYTNLETGESFITYRMAYEVTFTFTDPPGENFYDFNLESAATEEDFAKGNISSELLYDPFNSNLMRGMTDDSQISEQRVTYKFFYFGYEAQMSQSRWFRISLRTMPAEQFKYSSKLIKGYLASYDPYSQPVTTYTNVENGLGIFSAYTPYSKVVNVTFE
ncbi:MAG TPA: DUF4249 family protein [Cyclobacteriaceae bacterium]|nr:DUF4249 family protein [Cyclobacteriaceae bacterium]